MKILRHRVFIFLLLMAVLAFLPLLGLEGYRMRLFSLIFLWTALSGCWNIMSGYTGYIDFGPVTYFGVGSYSTALLMIRGGFSFLPSVVSAGVICAALAQIIGFSTLRLQGAYFAIATFAAAETMRQLVLEGDRIAGVDFFGGSHGLTLPLPPPGVFFYYALLGMVGLIVGLTLLLERSKFGYGLRAIRQAESTAELCGVPTLTLKVRAYVLSASLIGCLGGIEAYWLTYIIPDDVFNLLRTIQMVIMTLLGGMGTVLGPVLGAGFLTLISEYLGTEFVYDYLILVGLVIVVVTILMPQGIVGALRQKRGKKG